MSAVRRSLLLFGLPALAVLGAAIWWFSRPAAAPAPKAGSGPVLVRTTEVRAQDMPIRLPGLGAVQAWESVTVRSRIDGQLESVGFKEGDTVRQGQLIAQLDDRAQKAQLAQAVAQRSRDQAQLDNARQDLKRYVELARHAAIDRQTLDTQRAQVAALQATVQADEAQVQAAQVQLAYTRIVAPFAGRTGARLVDPGNLVRAADAQGLVVINQVDPIAVSFTVPDIAYGQIRDALLAAGQGADAAPDAIQVQVLSQGQSQVLGQGKLVLVDNQIDAASGTLRLKARLANPGQRLWPGQTVDVRLILGVRHDALVVPDPAVQRGAQGLFVYVVGKDDVAQPRTVRVLASQDGLSVIAQGLAAGDRVVVDGQYRLRPGVKVAEIQPQAGDGAKTSAGAKPVAVPAANAAS
ncbi:efflux RND transporter periplasmic adaptor subunit [uncultured Castellaniella sp.]|uniref:efflux RND transporter periplasmic adaptor subunit n=1 Tax=uncultured Castellaniella sp. TaxID=647907 RepID=UPI00262157C4|nr:efflux RND transporter periplasmic adaptor subunit [uncultured Castellaniella sp.]